MSALKLFVWDGVLVDYTSGVMFALAEDANQARDAICPGWTAAEAAIVGGANPDRPFGPQPGVNGGAGYCASIMHEDLRGEPKVYESTVGFSCWGGS